MNNTMTSVGYVQNISQDMGSIVEEATKKADAKLAVMLSQWPTAVVKKICTQLHVGDNYAIYTITALFDEV